MSKASIEARGRGRFAVVGEMSFATVPALWTQSRASFTAEAPAAEIDLSAVERVDSAGLALLIAWAREARRDDKAIRFVNPPTQLTALAQANQLGSLLGVEAA